MNKFSILNRLRPNNNIQPQELDGPPDAPAEEFNPEMNEAQQEASKAYAAHAQAMDDAKRNLSGLPGEVAAPEVQLSPQQSHEQLINQTSEGVRQLSPQETLAEQNKDSGVKQLSEEELKQEQYIRDIIQRSMR